MTRTVRRPSAGSQDLSGTIVELGEAFEDFKENHIVKMDAMTDRIGCMEADQNARKYETPVGRGSGLRRECNDYLRALAKGEDPQMAVTVLTGTTAGANAAPTVLVDEINQMIRRLNPVVGLVRHRKSGTGQINEIVTGREMNSGWAGESTRSETLTPVFNSVTLTPGTCYSYVKLSEESLDDVAFDLMELMAQQAAEDFSVQIGASILSGSGTNRPTGILNTAPTSTADTGVSPVRPFGTIQYVASGAAAGFQADLSGGVQSPVQNPAACIFDLFYSLNPAYRSNAHWVMNSNTLSLVRQFRDTNGNYLFVPGLISGQDDQILGRPISISESVADVATNSLPILFGDFARGYTLVTVGTDMRITVNDNITEPGYVFIYLRTRLAGNLTNSEAIKSIKIATS
ncbi:phage major capsid protein [Gammaproteobacteria bacterium]|nr:phage major capsid protein [Gammaproteobacteria bacterium]